MLTHVVIFRTRNAEKRSLIREGLETLKGIEGVCFLKIGEPVPSPRPVVDDFFDFALVAAFEDGEEGLKRYLEHPLHTAFAENYLKPAGAKITVFDIK